MGEERSWRDLHLLTLRETAQPSMAGAKLWKAASGSSKLHFSQCCLFMPSYTICLIVRRNCGCTGMKMTFYLGFAGAIWCFGSGCVSEKPKHMCFMYCLSGQGRMGSLQQSGLLGHSQLAFSCILTLAARPSYNLCKVCALHCSQLCTYCAAADELQGAL